MNSYYRDREQKNVAMRPYAEATLILLIVFLLAAMLSGPVGRFVGNAIDREAAYQEQRLNAAIHADMRRDIAQGEGRP